MAGLLDVARSVKDEFNVTHAEARRLVEFVFEDITKRVGDGESVNVRGFGVFKCKEMSPRTIRNPQTQQPTEVGASVRVLFTPAAITKDKLKLMRGLITEEEFKALHKEELNEAAAEGEKEAPKTAAAPKAESKGSAPAKTSAKPAAKPSAKPPKK